MRDSNTGFPTPRSSVVVAAVLVDDMEDEQKLKLTKKEEELAEQERRLAEQAAKLQAWEEELERRQRELSTNEHGISRHIVAAEVIGSPMESQKSSLRFGNLLGALSSNNVVASSSPLAEDRTEDFTVIPESQEFTLGDVELDDGPLRFAPIGEKTLEEQINTLSHADRRCYKNLKQRWEDRRAKKGGALYTREMILRFARNTKRKDKFFEERAWKVRIYTLI
jgi:hypothetical protein